MLFKCTCVLLPTGITQVRFLDYAWASWLGMLPGTFAYVYLGSLGKVAADVAGDGAAADGGIGSAKLLLYGELAEDCQCLPVVAQPLH
jgi:uncharacterized membrane protein YdjX (TVP38/TMEM64 family)